MSLNLLPFIATLNFGNRKNLTLLNVMHREGVKWHFVLDLKLMHRQSRMRWHIVVLKKLIPTFHFHAHSLADTVKWQCNNSGLQSILLEQIQIHKFINIIYMLFTVEQTCLIYLGLEMTMSSSTQATAACTYDHPRFLSKEFRISFKPLNP
jgi:hypothetical protein